jgi:predicted HTH transcriptional regulator
MIDKTALREALINAIVHNDYSREVAPVIEIYSDRLSITSYGGLIEGLSLEEFFNGMSMPGNRELMRIFKDMELVEHIGSGMNRILKVYDRNIFKMNEHFIEVGFPFADEYEQVTQQVTQQVESLLKCMEGEMNRTQIMQKLTLKDRNNFSKTYLEPALENGIIEMTQPDSPKSPTQKYRLTPKGVEIKKQLAGGKYE